jgi:hypothetical protein
VARGRPFQSNDRPSSRVFHAGCQAHACRQAYHGMHAGLSAGRATLMGQAGGPRAVRLPLSPGRSDEAPRDLHVGLIEFGCKLHCDSASRRDSEQVAVSSTRSTTDQTVDDGDRAHTSWARSSDNLGARYELDVERELMLLEPSNWSLAQSCDGVPAELRTNLRRGIPVLVALSVNSPSWRHGHQADRPACLLSGAGAKNARGAGGRLPPCAVALGCAQALDRVAGLEAATAIDRQRAFAADAEVSKIW